MSDSFISASRFNGFAHPDNTTQYDSLTGSIEGFTTESRKETPVRDAGTFGNLFVRVPANTTTTVTSTVTLMKSQTDTDVTVSIGAGITGVFEDNSNSATFP